MMDFFDEINSVHSLFLKRIYEPVDNQLVIRVEESIVSKQATDLPIVDKIISNVRNVEANGEGLTFELFFHKYASYTITNESFAEPVAEENGIGRLCKILSESPFLDFIRSQNIIEFVFDRKLTHYKIICENHIVDVLSLDNPTIKIIT